MSTYVYLECLDHDPPIQAEDESGQHLYDLPQIREDVANREALVEAWTANPWPSGIDALDYYTRHSARFLAQHPKCRVGIRDEYGRPYSLTDEDRNA